MRIKWDKAGRQHHLLPYRHTRCVVLAVIVTALLLPSLILLALVAAAGEGVPGLAKTAADPDALFWILDSGGAPGRRNRAVLRDPSQACGGGEGSLQTVRGLRRGGSRALVGDWDPGVLEGQSPQGLHPLPCPPGHPDTQRGTGPGSLGGEWPG